MTTYTVLAYFGKGFICLLWEFTKPQFNLSYCFASSSMIYSDFSKCFSMVSPKPCMCQIPLCNLHISWHHFSRSSYISPVCLRIRFPMWTVWGRSLESSSSSINFHHMIMRWEYFVCMCKYHTVNPILTTAAEMAHSPCRWFRQMCCCLLKPQCSLLQNLHAMALMWALGIVVEKTPGDFCPTNL